MFNNREYQYNNIITNTTTQIATGRGTLQAITVNTTAAGTIKIIDDIAGTTANIGTLQASILPGTYFFNTVFSKGLRIVTAAASDITVSYTQG